MRTGWLLMVMPRSRSRSMLSSTCACMSLAASVPVSSRKRSASVDLPWSMCATMQKLRMRVGSMLRARRQGCWLSGLESQLERRACAAGRRRADLHGQRGLVEVVQARVHEGLQAAEGRRDAEQPGGLNAVVAVQLEEHLSLRVARIGIDDVPIPIRQSLFRNPLADEIKLEPGGHHRPELAFVVHLPEPRQHQRT